MPQASTYQRTKEYLLANPGQYLTSKALMNALNLKDADERRRVGKSLSALFGGKSSAIARRQNDEGRYEYGYAGEQQPEPEARKRSSKARKSRAAQPPGSKTVRPAQKQKGAVQPRQSPGASSLKKVANFIRAYLDLSSEERREAYEWLKEQSA